MAPLIGFTGRMGAGKTTAAQIVTRHFPGFERVSFAGPMRHQLALSLASGDRLPPLPEDVKKFAMSLQGMDYHQLLDLLYRKPTPYEVRRLLQHWGSSFIEKDRMYWVKKLEATLKPGHRYVIDDVRFPWEAQWVLSRDGLLIGITRPNPIAEPLLSSHPSETMVEGCLQMVQVTIANDGTLEELEEALVRILRRYFGWKTLRSSKE